MTTTNNLITIENSQDIIKEIEDAFYDIPFENSRFQTEAFVIAAQITPERAYRSIGLRMMTKLQALTANKFNQQKVQVDLDEIEYKIASGKLNEFDVRRELIKKEEILSQQAWSEKLINDAIQELNVLYAHFKKLPKYSREQFEAAERLHFEQKLNRQVLGLEGAKESLINMNDDVNALTAYEQEVVMLENASTEDLLKLTSNLTNLLKPKP